MAGHVDPGALLGGVPHGSGVWVRDGEVTLQATFSGGLAHGPGELKSASGDAYSGEWRHGCRHGNGTHTWRDAGRGATVYKGEWAHGVPHGRGVLRCAERGEATEAVWEHGCVEGEAEVRTWRSGAAAAGGSETSRGQTLYRGQMRGGVRSGQGNWSPVAGPLAGCAYMGEMARDLPEGEGACNLAGGAVYSGGWAAGRPHGVGVLRHAAGASYEGSFERGVRHGTGAWFDDEGGGEGGDEGGGEGGGEAGAGGPVGGGVRGGRRYQGQWRHDLMHGVGRSVEAAAAGVQLYAGEHAAGRRDGRGRCEYVRWGAECGGEAEDGESRSVYDGEWAGGRRSGVGQASLRLAPEQHVTGRWEEGAWVGVGEVRRRVWRGGTEVTRT